MGWAGFRPVVYDNLCRGDAWAVQWGPLVVADIADGSTLRRVLHQYRVAAVVHLAAYAYVGESMRLPEVYFSNNLAGTLSLLHAMIDALLHCND